jgi:hypothetical protein
LAEANKPQEAAFVHFTEKANREKAEARARRKSALRKMPDIPAGMQHFNKIVGRKEEERSSWHATVSTMVPPEPVLIDYFINLYKYESEAKALESRELAKRNMAIATAHFTEIGRTKLQGAFVLDVENMPAESQQWLLH